MWTSWALTWRFYFGVGGRGVSILQILWVVSRILFLQVVVEKSMAPLLRTPVPVKLRFFDFPFCHILSAFNRESSLLLIDHVVRLSHPDNPGQSPPPPSHGP